MSRFIRSPLVHRIKSCSQIDDGIDTGKDVPLQIVSNRWVVDFADVQVHSSRSGQRWSSIVDNAVGERVESIDKAIVELWWGVDQVGPLACDRSTFGCGQRSDDVDQGYRLGRFVVWTWLVPSDHISNRDRRLIAFEIDRWWSRQCLGNGNRSVIDGRDRNRQSCTGELWIRNPSGGSVIADRVEDFSDSIEVCRWHESDVAVDQGDRPSASGQQLDTGNGQRLVILERTSADIARECLTIKIQRVVFVDRSVLTERLRWVVDFGNLDRQRGVDRNATWLRVGHLVDNQNGPAVNVCWSGIHHTIIARIVRGIGSYNRCGSLTGLWLLNDRKQLADEAFVDKIVGRYVDWVAGIDRFLGGRELIIDGKGERRWQDEDFGSSRTGQTKTVFDRVVKKVGGVDSAGRWCVDHSGAIGVERYGSTEDCSCHRTDPDRVDTGLVGPWTVVPHHVQRTWCPGQTDDIESSRCARIIYGNRPIVDRSDVDGQSRIGRQGRSAIVGTADDETHWTEEVQCWGELKRPVCKDCSNALGSRWRGDQRKGNGLSRLTCRTRCEYLGWKNHQRSGGVFGNAVVCLNDHRSVIDWRYGDRQGCVGRKSRRTVVGSSNHHVDRAIEIRCGSEFKNPRCIDYRGALGCRRWCYDRECDQLSRLIGRSRREHIRGVDQQGRRGVLGDRKGRIDHDGCIVDGVDVHCHRTRRNVVEVVANGVREGHRSVVVSSGREANRLGSPGTFERNRTAFGRLGDRNDPSRTTESVHVVCHNVVGINRCIFVDGKHIVDRR